MFQYWGSDSYTPCLSLPGACSEGSEPWYDHTDRSWLGAHSVQYVALYVLSAVQ